MKEDSFSFSLTDFLAYLFPGVLWLIIIAILLRLSPFRQLIPDFPVNLVTGLILVAVAYFMGMINASFTLVFEGRLYRFYKLPNPLLSIYLDGHEDNVQIAFNEIFGKQDFWSTDNFYITRSLIREKMPNCAAAYTRQSSLRQARRNSIIPTVMLGFTGAVIGGRILLLSGFTGNNAIWGVGVVLVSVIGAYIVVKRLVIGMHANRKREVREVYSGLLSFYSQSYKK